MKNSTLFILFVFVFGGAFAHSQSPAETQTVEKDGISLAVPKDWKNNEAPAPITFVLSNPKNDTSVVVVKEAKTEMGVKDLQEYFEFKLEKISGSWSEPKLSPAQSGDVNGNPARSTAGSASLSDGQGGRIGANVCVATVEGKDSYYLIIITQQAGANANPGPIFAGILKSFKAP